MDSEVLNSHLLKRDWRFPVSFQKEVQVGSEGSIQSSRTRSWTQDQRSPPRSWGSGGWVSHQPGSGGQYHFPQFAATAPHWPGPRSQLLAAGSDGAVESEHQSEAAQ